MRLTSVEVAGDLSSEVREAKAVEHSSEDGEVHAEVVVAVGTAASAPSADDAEGLVTATSRAPSRTQIGTPPSRLNC